MSRPLELSLRTGWYILKNKLRGRKRFPLVTMLEPLEMCNLACIGCGRIREYKPVIDRMMSVEEALKAVDEAGAPIVSIAGGEPLIHPGIYDIVEGCIQRKKFVYLCSNALLMERDMKYIKPSKYLCWVVHLDGMEEAHDISVARKGVWKVAMRAIRSALDRGYRVCTNTTLLQGSNAQDLHQMFGMLTDMGIEGIMVTTGYDFEAVEERGVFLSRRESTQLFREVLSDEALKKYRFYNNPLYLEFLRGNREYQCTTWSNPTYTVLGWRKPCYSLADGHTRNLQELYEPQLWERYGVGKDRRCANCMMHCGFESATIFGALSNPKDMWTMIKGGAVQKSGVSAG